MSASHKNRLKRVRNGAFASESDDISIPASMSIKILATGEIVKIAPSFDHQACIKGRPIWVDQENNIYGRCHEWPIPHGCVKVGSKDDRLFFFTLEKYKEFKNYLNKLIEMDILQWPVESNRLNYPGMPDWGLKPIYQGKKLWMIVFEKTILLPEGSRGKKWQIGYDRIKILMCQKNEIILIKKF